MPLSTEFQLVLSNFQHFSISAFTFMRLRSLTVRNYRLHKDHTLEFDPSRNLLGGDNESGKSTLAEAIHRALFFRHRSGGEVQKSMVSDRHNGIPEVDLVFEAADAIWTLEKKFGGSTKGAIRLSSDTGENLTGDAAEEKLAILTGNNKGDATSAKQLSTRWAHLWVWQGSAGEDASTHAATHKDDLVRRLQEQGLAAIMQSATDERVRESVRASYSEIFTPTGSVRAGSKLDKSKKDLADAEAALAQTEDQSKRLEAAVADQRDAEAILQESKKHLPQTRAELTAVQAGLAQAKDLRAKVENHQKDHAAAAAEHTKLLETDKLIHQLHAQAAAARNALLPKDELGKALATQAEITATAAEAAEKSRRSTENSLRTARHLRELAAACLLKIEKSAELAILQEKLAKVTELAKSLREQQASLAALPIITASNLEKLRKLDASRNLAQNRLETIAAGIEILESNADILLDGSTLTPGESRIITEASELAIGSGIRLQIRPGGGTSLAEARQEFSNLSQQFTEKLDHLGISDLENAAEILIKRQAITQQISETENKLSTLGAKELPSQLAAAESAAQASAAELQLRQAKLAQPQNLPTTLDAARSFLKSSETDLEKQQETENSLRKKSDAARDAQNAAAKALQKHQTAITEEKQKLRDLEITASTHESSAGDATTRQQNIAKAQTKQLAAKNALDSASTALADLRPEQLAASEKRLHRILEQETNKQNDAEKRIAVAASSLAQDGTRDPAADLLTAIARRDARADENNRENRRAEAIRLLHRLFEKSQAEIGTSLTTPIAERVTRYLESVMGRGIEAGVDLRDPAKPALSIARPGDPAPLPFAQLSGGAKEQVAAALRLAIAEILASGHDGCLPVLFDDAFANADPTRARSLQIMLDQAATQGLQIIVLSCTPADYHSLGAKESRLATPR